MIIILSQKEGYNAAHADYLRKNIYEQANALEGVRLVTTKLFLYLYLYYITSLSMYNDYVYLAFIAE